MKPTLKAPGSKRSKLKCDRLLRSCAFNFILRRYIPARIEGVKVYDTNDGSVEIDLQVRPGPV
jgi:hypothetical protein